MSSFSSVAAAAVVAAYDFSSSATVVDLGGGDGTLLTAILKNCRSAMQTNGRVLLVEAVIQPGTATSSVSAWI